MNILIDGKLANLQIVKIDHLGFEVYHEIRDGKHVREISVPSGSFDRKFNFFTCGHRFQNVEEE